jgi:hypothetical protein
VNAALKLALFVAINAPSTLPSFMFTSGSTFDGLYIYKYVTVLALGG